MAEKLKVLDAPAGAIYKAGATNGGHVYWVKAASALDFAEFYEKYFVKYDNGQSSVHSTIQSAINACTANVGDVVYVTEGYTQTITTIAEVAVNKNGVSVLGLGSGDSIPTITISSTDNAGSVAVSGDGSALKNILLVTNDDALTNALLVTGNGCDIDIVHKDTALSIEAANVVKLSTADNCSLRLRHLGFTGGDAGVRCIAVDDCDNVNIYVESYGKQTTAVVNFITTASTNVTINGVAHLQGTTDGSKLVVDTIGGSTFFARIDDKSAGATFSGGSGSPMAMDDVSSVASLLVAPVADVTTTTNMRDSIGIKTDAAAYAVAATKSLMAYAKGILNTNVLATGTFTTSSTTVPADTGRGEVTNYWNGCLLIPLTGAAAFQPRLITVFTATTGVFTLDADTPFTTVPSTVTYAIVRGQGGLAPAADATSTATAADGVGNKADAAVLSAGTTNSLMAYSKGILKGASKINTVSLANTDLTGTVTRFTVANGPILVKRLGLVTPVALAAGANTLKFSFTPTGGGATDLCGATDTASSGAQQIWSVDGTKATGLVKSTDVGILAAGQAQTAPLILSSGVIQTIFSAGAPASGSAVLFIEWEPLNGSATVA